MRLVIVNPQNIRKGPIHSIQQDVPDHQVPDWVSDTLHRSITGRDFLVSNIVINHHDGGMEIWTR